MLVLPVSAAYCRVVFPCYVGAVTNQILSDVHSRTRVLHYLFVNVLPILTYLYLLSKKYLICISRQRKTFWKVSRLDDFVINAIANLFVHDRLKIPEAYSEPSRRSKMELFVNLVYG